MSRTLATSLALSCPPTCTRGTSASEASTSCTCAARMSTGRRRRTRRRRKGSARGPSVTATPPSTRASTTGLTSALTTLAAPPHPPRRPSCTKCFGRCTLRGWSSQTMCTSFTVRRRATGRCRTGTWSARARGVATRMPAATSATRARSCSTPRSSSARGAPRVDSHPRRVPAATSSWTSRHSRRRWRGGPKTPRRRGGSGLPTRWP